MPVTATTIKIGADGTGVSEPLAPFIGQAWSITEVAAECPVNTDGALLWRRGTVTGLLLKVTNVGEFTSEAFSPSLPVSANEPIVIQAQGITPGQAVVTLTYDQEGTSN